LRNGLQNLYHQKSGDTTCDRLLALADAMQEVIDFTPQSLGDAPYNRIMRASTAAEMMLFGLLNLWGRWSLSKTCFTA
jgi:hypothetical protein